MQKHAEKEFGSIHLWRQASSRSWCNDLKFVQKSRRKEEEEKEDRRKRDWIIVFPHGEERAKEITPDGGREGEMVFAGLYLEEGYFGNFVQG